MNAHVDLRSATLIVSVLLLMIWIFPVSVLAQTYPLIYRLHSGFIDRSFSEVGPDYHYNDGRIFHYSASDPFFISSFDESHYYNSSHLDNPEYSVENFGFEGFTDYQQDYIIYRSPASENSNLAYRISKLNYQGYYLEDSYYHIVDGAPALAVQRKYFYNDDYKLVRMTRKSASPVMNWNYEYILDSLGRRTDEIVTSSPDSINWSPVKSLHYTYSGLPVSGNYQFEKHAPYTPEDLFYGSDFPAYPPYMSDQWIIESISVINSLGITQTYPIDMTWGARATASFNTGYCSSCVEWNCFGLMVKSYTHDYTTEENQSINLSYELSVVATSDPEHTPSVIDVTTNPNPTRESAKLYIILRNAATVLLSTYNMRGQQVKRECFLYQPNNQSAYTWMAVDSKGDKLPAGLYIIKISAGTESKTTRVVVID